MLKSELARKYYDINLKTLMRWIASNKNLLKELDKTGYVKTSKRLTPRQISIIHKYLG